jgi:hypothetical protein
MLIHPMAERLRGLGLAAMADAFLDMHNQSAADDLSREDWLGLLIDREVTARDNKRLGRRLTSPGCDRTRWSRTPICARRAVSTAACSSRSRRVAGSATATTC